MNLNEQNWRIIAKLDPDKNISDDNLKIILQSNPDAVIVGGTQNITAVNTSQLIDRIHNIGFEGALIQEISQAAAINSKVKGYIVPVVINAQDKEWITGAHYKAIKSLGQMIDWDMIIPFGYIVCNPDSAVGKLTGTAPLELNDALAYTDLANKVFRFPVIYIEYSGLYGDPKLVKEVADACGETKVFYGGGIKTANQAVEMLKLVDTIVVGNALYENLQLICEIKKACL